MLCTAAVRETGGVFVAVPAADCEDSAGVAAEAPVVPDEFAVALVIDPAPLDPPPGAADGAGAAPAVAVGFGWLSFGASDLELDVGCGVGLGVGDGEGEGVGGLPPL